MLFDINASSVIDDAEVMGSRTNTALAVPVPVPVPAWHRSSSNPRLGAAQARAHSSSRCASSAKIAPSVCISDSSMPIELEVVSLKVTDSSLIASAATANTEGRSSHSSNPPAGMPGQRHTQRTSCVRVYMYVCGCGKFMTTYRLNMSSR